MLHDPDNIQLELWAFDVERLAEQQRRLASPA